MNSSQLSGTSLKTKVISIMLLAVISLFVVSNYFFQFFIDEIEQQHGELLVKQQLNTVLERSRVFFEQDSKLISQALLRNDFQSWMKEASNAVLQERAISAIQHNCEVNQCSGWFIFDHKTRNGFDWNHSKEDYFASPLIPGRDVWYDEFIESGKDFLVDVNVHPLDRQYYAFFDYLVKEDGQILGVVGNYIAIEQLVSAILDNPKEGPVNVIIDNRRKFRVNPSIARYDEQLEILATINNKDIKDVLRTRDEAVFQALLSDLKEQANTSVQSLSIYGTQYLTAVNYMPDLDWYFITLYPKSQLTNAIDTIPFLIYSLSFILVFVLLTGCWISPQPLS